jgi:hypothetical protein
MPLSAAVMEALVRVPLATIRVPFKNGMDNLF